MLTLPGVVNWAELSDNETDVAPTAALFNVAVHVVLWLLFSDPALQFRLVSAGSVVSVRFAVRVPPFKLAVITAVSSEVTPVTFAENCALVCPLRTVTLPWTVTCALPSDRVTLVFDDAAAVSATVQVDVPAALKELGEQLSVLSAAGAGATRVMFAVRFTPFKVPVTVAVSPVEIVPAVTVN
jgi:hypothetical protein